MRGLTALSVETRTKRSQPEATAVSAVTRVAIALLRIASTGLASISGTCLWAAAWKTTSGLKRCITSSMRSGSLQSASTDSTRVKCRSSIISRSIRKRLSSA